MPGGSMTWQETYGNGATISMEPNITGTVPGKILTVRNKAKSGYCEEARGRAVRTIVLRGSEIATRLV